MHGVWVDRAGGGGGAEVEIADEEAGAGAVEDGEADGGDDPMIGGCSEIRDCEKWGDRRSDMYNDCISKSEVCER